MDTKNLSSEESEDNDNSLTPVLKGYLQKWTNCKILNKVAYMCSIKISA